MGEITAIYSHYIIDLSSNNNFVQVPVMQGDGNNVRKIEIELIENNQPYNIDTTSTAVYIAGTKPDTKTILNDCTITSEGYILVDITYQMSAAPGRGDYEIVLIDKNKNNQLKSFPFYILVTGAAYDASEITSSDEYQALAKTLGDVSKITKEAIEKIENIDTLQIQWQSAEDTRVANENARIESENTRDIAEQERNSNEDNRKAAETGRDDAEKIRISNENQRISNENDRKTEEEKRQSEESKRIASENARNSAESIRKDNETDRQTAENQRNTDEGIRQSNEATREQNEKKRISQESERQSNTKTMLDNAQTAIDKVDSVTSDCVTATNRANDISLDLELKRDTDYYRGEKGDPGVVYTLDAVFGFQIEDGDLMLYYKDGEVAPAFEIDEDGHLLYEISE